MKRHLIYALLPLTALLVMFTSCKDGDDALVPAATRTYTMRLHAIVTGYDANATRATAYTFADGDEVYVLFHQGEARISGAAVYSSATDLWTITPSQALADTDESRCQLAFFLAAGTTSSSAVTLTQQTRIYTDGEATFQLADGMLTVQAQLAPALGRIRFRGEVGQRATVTGLAFAGSFDLNTHSFSLSPSKFTATCGADGYTPYYYCAFVNADTRQLTFEFSAESGLRRNFGAGVLAAGTSGYVTIPTADSHEGWTLVNLGSGGEITFATISKPDATNVRATRVSLTATVTSVGGGRLSQTGFVIATHSSPTLADTTLDCGTATTLSTQATGLTPEKRYYVRAFAVNEAGTTYSEEITFTTPAKNDGEGNVELENWDSEIDWNRDNSSNASIEINTFTEDADWNLSYGSTANIDITFFSDDENWNDQ